MPQPGGLTTHILDTANGCPAEAVRVRLYRIVGEDERSACIKEIRTNGQGRSPEPLLTGGALIPGRYVLDFAVADYFRSKGHVLPDPPFLDIVTVAFGIADEGVHYHVPLLVSPFGYSTYRGS